MADAAWAHLLIRSTRPHRWQPDVLRAQPPENAFVDMGRNAEVGISCGNVLILADLTLPILFRHAICRNLLDVGEICGFIMK